MSDSVYIHNDSCCKTIQLQHTYNTDDIVGCNEIVNDDSFRSNT